MKAEIYYEDGVLNLDLVLTPETGADLKALKSFMAVMGKPTKVEAIGFGCNRKFATPIMLSISQHSTWSKFYPGDKKEV